MKVLIATFLFLAILPAFCQEQPGETNSQPPDNTQPPTANRATPSALGVAPGTEALKDKDLYEGTGYFHPFRRMPKFILTDQKRIWTSPFHSKKSDIKYWAIFGGATAALIATDKYVSHNAPNPHWLQTVGNDASYLGEPYALLPITAGFYFYGSATGNERFRETGLLSFETLADVTVVELAIKSITNRERPTEEPPTDTSSLLNLHGGTRVSHRAMPSGPSPWHPSSPTNTTISCGSKFSPMPMP